MPKYRISATKIGDWRKAAKIISELKTTNAEVGAIMYDQSKKSRKRLVSNIERQVYNWPPLSPKWQLEKERRGFDPRIMIARGEYLDAIKVQRMGKNMWAIGISANAKNSEGKSLAYIGLVHEYGIGSNPPRPHWRREYSMFKQQLARALTMHLGRKVSLKIR